MFWSGITGMAEPLGAFIGMGIIYLVKGGNVDCDPNSLFVFGILFGITAGIMTRSVIIPNYDS